MPRRRESRLRRLLRSDTFWAWVMFGCVIGPIPLLLLVVAVVKLT